MTTPSSAGTPRSITEDFIRRATAQRERLGLSQTRVARRMSERGFPWWQVTVSRTESGDRPIHLDEALTLAEELGMPLALSSEELLSELAAASVRISALTAELEEVRAEAQQAARDHAEARAALDRIENVIKESR